MLVEKKSCCKSNGMLRAVLHVGEAAWYAHKRSRLLYRQCFQR